MLCRKYTYNNNINKVSEHYILISTIGKYILNHFDNSEIPGLTRYPSAVFSKDDYSPAALATRWQGYFEGATGFPKGKNKQSRSINGGKKLCMSL